MKITLDPRNKLQKARRILQAIGIEIKAESLAQKATLDQISELSELGTNEASQLVEVVHHMNAFDELVTDNLNKMNVGERYEDIRENFESIIKDLERKVKGAHSDQKVSSLINKMQDRLMKWKRGDIRERFQKIKVAYESVFGDADEQIRREVSILEAYKDYREALQQSVILSQVLKKRSEDEREKILVKFQEANDKVNAFPVDGDPIKLGGLKMEKDEIQRQLDKMDRRQEIASSLYGKLTVAYGISEAVMTRYAQTTEVRERVQRESSLFYTANKGVMTTLAATLMQLEGTNEQAKVMEEFGKQIKQALAKVNETSGLAESILSKATETAYSVQFTPEQIRELYENTVKFKLVQDQKTSELRRLRDENLEKVRIEIEKGQRLLADAQITSIQIQSEFKLKNSESSSNIELNIEDQPNIKKNIKKKLQLENPSPSRKKPLLK